MSKKEKKVKEAKEPRVTKISIAEGIVAGIVADESIDAKGRRKVFIERLVEACPGTSVQCAKSYFQMFKYELDGKGGRYKHHNKKKPEPIAAVDVNEGGESSNEAAAA